MQSASASAVSTPPVLAPRTLQKRRRHVLTLGQAGSVVVVWLACWLLGGNAPIHEQWTAPLVVGFILLSLLSRNMYWIAASGALISLGFRWAVQVSHWHDISWGQWYSISSLLSGHSMFESSPLTGMSLANYLPLGNLYGGLLIALGIHDYWNVWHVIVLALLLLPVLLRPSLPALLVFLAAANYFPFSDYTTGGGSVEISYALTFAAIFLFRSGMLDGAVVLFAWASMVRQPSLMLIPFVALLLWQARDWRRLKLFALLLLLFGGLFLILDPWNAYEATYGIWAPYAQELFNGNGGLKANFSISTLLATLAGPQVAWDQWHALYFPLTLASIAALLTVAWKSGRRDTVLALAVTATIFVYILARGYAQLHYVIGTAAPFLAFVIKPARRPEQIGTWMAGALVMALLWLGIMPVPLFATGKCLQLWTALRANGPEAAIASEAIVTPFSRLPIPVATHDFFLTESAEFELSRPSAVAALVISGEHVSMTNVHGVPLPYANENQRRGALTSGVVEASVDGRDFFELLRFHPAGSYNAYPLRLDLPATPQPVRFLRLRPLATYDHHPAWILGQVRVFAR